MQNPPLNLTLNQVPFNGKGALSHLGIQVVATEDVLALRDQWTERGLSPREEMVLNCLAKGLTYKQIADQLGISIDTIRTYLRRIYEKLHVQSRTEAVAKYLRP